MAASTEAKIKTFPSPGRPPARMLAPLVPTIRLLAGLPGYLTSSLPGLTRPGVARLGSPRPGSGSARLDRVASVQAQPGPAGPRQGQHVPGLALKVVA